MQILVGGFFFAPTISLSSILNLGLMLVMSNESKNLRFLRMDEVRARIPISRSRIYCMIAEGKFPRQVQLGARSVAWIESEIDQWMEDRIMEAKNEQGIDVDSESNGFDARKGDV